VTYRRLLVLLRPYLGLITLAVIASALVASLDALTMVLLIPFTSALFSSDGGGGGQPSQMQRLLDATIYEWGWIDLGGDQLAAINQVIIVLMGVFVVKNVVAFVRTYVLATTQQAVNRDLRDTVYDHLVALDLSFFGRTRTGQIVSRLTTEIEQLRLLVTSEASKLISSVFEFLVAFLAMLAISWKMTIAACVVIPGTMAVWGPLVRVLRRRDHRVLHLGGEVNSHLFETLAGIRLVKSSSAEERERKRFHGLTAEYMRLFIRAHVARGLAAPMTEILTAAGTALILWYGARQVVAGVMGPEEFIAFLGLSIRLYSPVKAIAKFPALAQPGIVAAERVFEFLDAPVEIGDRPEARPLSGFEEEIVFDDVTFRYGDGAAALEEVSLTVPKGTVIALVGPSGAGKSTLVDLLGRFFEVSDGAIRIDGQDIRDVRLADLRGLMGIVSQETVLFHDTVRSNIAYGRPEASPDEVKAAARAANAHEFIEQMAEGYDTVVGERGVELSGGQRQRIAIARALLRDPPILIFDEATSALDTESERLIQDAIERLLEGRTVFVVAHRLSTVQRADQILVLDGGRVLERGTHEELLELDGRYRHLHDLQFDG
jgi:subfamily B ATP-binding cassette protein MsbA